MQSLHSIKNQRLYSWHTVKNKHKGAIIQTFLLFPKNCHDSPEALLSLHKGAPRGDQIESTTGATVPLPIMDGDTFSCFLTQATIVFGKDHPPVLQLYKAKILCQSHAKKHTSDGPKNTNFPQEKTSLTPTSKAEQRDLIENFPVLAPCQTNPCLL